MKYLVIIIGLLLLFTSCDSFVKSLYIEEAKKLESQGKLNESVQIYKKIIALDSLDEGPYIKIGQMLGHLSRFDESIYYFRQGIKLNPKEPYTYSGIGHIKNRVGELDSALFYFNQAIELDPQNENFLSNKAQIFQNLGEHEKAIELFELALKQNSNYLGALNGMAISYLSTMDIDKAELLIIKAVELDSLDCNTILSFATLMIAKGNKTAACEYSRKANQYCNRLNVSEELKNMEYQFCN